MLYINLVLTDISFADDADINLFRDVNSNGVLDSTDRQLGRVTSSSTSSNAHAYLAIQIYLNSQLYLADYH